MQNEKNKLFDREFSLTHRQKIEVLEQLEATDCIRIGPNNNPRYGDSEVYEFTKDVDLMPYGYEESIKLYIKAYLTKERWEDVILVISFHKSGMYP